MNLKSLDKEKCITHTYVLKEDKYKISSFVKSVMLPESLAELLKFIKKREIRISDIGGWIMSKNPFIINFDFSEKTLNKDTSFLYVIGDISDNDLDKVRNQIIDILRDRFRRLLDDKKKITTKDDEDIFNELIDKVFDCKLELREIEKSELENNKILSKVWSSYITYLLTKGELEFSIDYSVTKKLSTVLKEMTEKGILDDYSEKNISEIPKNHLAIASPKECYDIEIEEGKNSEDSKCTYSIRENVLLNFKLRNNGSSIEASSNVIYVDNKPFSFVLSIGIDDVLTDKFLIKLFVSSTSWVNENFNSDSKLKLKTKDKVSLYVCPNSISNYYTRLEILNKSDEENMYNKFLSKLDSEILNKMTNGKVDLSQVLQNTSKFLDDKNLDKGNIFMGIPVSAHIRAEASNSLDFGVAMKDKEAFYNTVYNTLSRYIKITESEELPIVKDSVVDTFEFKKTHFDIDKITLNNPNLEQINICYWTTTDTDFDRFKVFIENLNTKKTSKKPQQEVFKKIDDSLYEMEVDSKCIRVNLLHMNSIQLTTPLESNDKYPSKNDKRVRVSKNKTIIEDEYSKYKNIDFNNSERTYTLNILEIDDYHNQYTISKYDPSDTIKQAFLELNHTVQRINQVPSLNRRIIEAKAKQNTKLADNLSKSLNPDKLFDIYKSSLLDTFSKKGITVKVNDEELNNGDKEIYGFISEFIGGNKVYLMSKLNKDGYFIKDISKYEKGSSRRTRRGAISDSSNSNDWVPSYRFTEIAQKYTQRIKTLNIEESELWSIIEDNISNNNSKKILFVSAAERKQMVSLRNDSISNDIKILKNIDNMAIVRVNDMAKEVPFAVIYKREKESLRWVLSHNQGLCMKSKNLYYDIGQRGDTMQVPVKTSKLLPKNKLLMKRKAIEFLIASNNESLFEESAIIASGLRKVNVAFGASTNLPMPLFIMKNISNELSFLMSYDEKENDELDEEITEIIPLDETFKEIEANMQITFFDLM